MTPPSTKLLSLAELEEMRADALADDVEIDLEKMSPWTPKQAMDYFESGGEVEPAPPVAETTLPFTNGSAPTGTTPWLGCLEKKADATCRVVVFNWTGNRGGQGSAHNIRRMPLNWSQALGAEFEVYEVSLPGRGTRMKDPLRTETPKMVAEMADAMCALSTRHASPARPMPANRCTLEHPLGAILRRPSVWLC